MSLQIWYQFLILHVKYKALKTREKISHDKPLQIQLLTYTQFPTKAL